MLVEKTGNTYMVSFQGLLRGLTGSQFLLSLVPSSTVTSSQSGVFRMEINGVGGSFTLSTGGPLATYVLAPGAAADQVRDALNALLGTDVVVVEDDGSGYDIDFTAAPDFETIDLSVNPLNLDNSVDISPLMAGIKYFNAENLNIDLAEQDEVFNIRGTTAETNVFGHAGDERYYVSSAADEDLATALITDFLLGNLDDIFGNLNLDAGQGRHLLMVSDEAALAGDQDVVITDQPTSTPQLDGTEIEITGLAIGAVTYQADTAGNFADGITIWSGFGDDTVSIDGTHYRAGLQTITTPNTGLGNDSVTVALDALDDDGFFVLNTQGPYNDFFTIGDDDEVAGAESTLPLIIFGGQGRDTIVGGQANDIIFGDRGRVL